MVVKRTPTVLVYSEVSADGKTTHRRGASSKPMMVFEHPEVRQFRHELRAASDAIMVGSNTIRIDDPLLTVRDAPGPNPLRVVPSAYGSLPLDANIFKDGNPTLIAVSEAAPESAVRALKDVGASVVRCGERQVELEGLLSRLWERGVRSLVVEGGATLLAALFRQHLVGRLIVQQLPVIFGGDDTPAMVGGQALADITGAIPLTLRSVERIAEHAVITYECS